MLNKIGSILGLRLFSQYSFSNKGIDEFKTHYLIHFSNEMIFWDQLFQYDGLFFLTPKNPLLSNTYDWFMPESGKEKAFVRSKLLPRENKQE